MLKSKLVTITDFCANRLNNKRDIHVYLPPSYEFDLNKRYPVLYMHDGQNIFHPAKGTNESWNVHLACDRLIAEGKMAEIIVVGIPNMGTERISEYTHFEFPFIGDYTQEFKGLLYEDFIINDLKPYIDSTFRTLTDSENTALMGSSMGGLVTYHIGFRRPDIFGKLGIVSPFMINVKKETLEPLPHYEKYDSKKPLKIWMDIGGYEGLILVEHVRSIAEELIEVGYLPNEELVFYCDLEAAHTEKDWAERMHAPLLFFFGNIGEPEALTLEGRDTIGIEGMKVYINPIVRYNSGFVMSALEGKFTVEKPEILEVKSNGEIIPKSEGTTKVKLEFSGVTAEREYTIIKELPEKVSISVNVYVPEASCGETINLYGFELSRKDEQLYSNKFLLPRDIAIRFSISREFDFDNRTVEADKEGKRVIRSIKLSEDMCLDYRVERWIDSK